MIDREPRTRRRPAFQVESLENRGLLSVLAPTPTIPAEVHSASQLVPLEGNFGGTARVSPVPGSANSVVYAVEITAYGQFSQPQLGRFSLQAHQIVTIDRQTEVSVVTDGKAALTAANGDLFLDYSGIGLPNGVGFNDAYLFTIDGGTRRFSGATGSGVIQSTDVPGRTTRSSLFSLGSSHRSARIVVESRTMETIARWLMGVHWWRRYAGPFPDPPPRPSPARREGEKKPSPLAARVGWGRDEARLSSPPFALLEPARLPDATERCIEK